MAPDFSFPIRDRSRRQLCGVAPPGSWTKVPCQQKCQQYTSWRENRCRDDASGIRNQLSPTQTNDRQRNDITPSKITNICAGKIKLFSRNKEPLPQVPFAVLTLNTSAGTRLDEAEEGGRSGTERLWTWTIDARACASVYLGKGVRCKEPDRCKRERRGNKWTLSTSR